MRMAMSPDQQRIAGVIHDEIRRNAGNPPFSVIRPAI